MPKRVYVVSLGCAKNLTDSEVMVGALEQSGYNLTENIEQADFALINTCAFIQDAIEESVQEILQIAQHKEDNSGLKIVVAGCLAQRYSEELKEELAEVDAFVGTTRYGDIVEVFDRLSAEDKVLFVDEDHCIAQTEVRTILTKLPTAYLKISEGCSRKCTYCVIPQLRGPYKSKAEEDLLKEARDLVARGVTELILVAQDITLYGIDRYREKRIASLLRQLDKIEGLKWIRLLYAYPEGLDEDIIDAMAQSEKVVPYIDMPLQHVNDRLLKQMGRTTTKEKIIDIYELLKAKMPDIVLRTTLITGFPGEAEEDVKEVLSFIRDYPFDKLGVFTYSQEEGTPAAQMSGQLSEAVKQARRSKIMRAQQKNAKKINRSFVGLKTEALICDKIDDRHYLARTYRDAPGVDGAMLLTSDSLLEEGQYHWCEITSADEYDMTGIVLHEHCK